MLLRNFAVFILFVEWPIALPNSFTPTRNQYILPAPASMEADTVSLLLSSNFFDMIHYTSASTLFACKGYMHHKGAAQITIKNDTRQQY